MEKTIDKKRNRLRVSEQRYLTKMYIYYCRPEINYRNDLEVEKIMNETTFAKLIYELDKKLEELQEYRNDNITSKDCFSNSTFKNLLNFSQAHEINTEKMHVAKLVNDIFIENCMSKLYSKDYYDYYFEYACNMIINFSKKNNVDIFKGVECFKKALKKCSVNNIEPTLLNIQLLQQKDA